MVTDMFREETKYPIIEPDVECLDCGWSGLATEIIALTNGFVEYSYCPICQSRKIDYASGEGE